MDSDIILHILTEYPNHKLCAQWSEKNPTQNKQKTKPQTPLPSCTFILQLQVKRRK